MLYFTRIHFALIDFQRLQTVVANLEKHADIARSVRRCVSMTNCVQPSTAAVNVTLLAFAAVAPCCCGAVAAGRRPCSNRSISPACPPGPQRQTRCTLPTVRTDRGTDGRTPYHYTVPAAHSCDQCQPCKLKVRTSNFLFGSFSWFTQTVRN